MPIGSHHDCYNVFIARRKFRKFGVGQPPFAKTRVPFTQCFLRNRGGVIRFYNFKGKLLGINGDIVSLEADTAGRIDIPFEQIAKANIEYEF